MMRSKEFRGMKYIFTCHSERSEESRDLSIWRAWRFLTAFGMTFFMHSFLNTL